MPFLFKRLALFLSIAAAFAADKDKDRFEAGPASTFAAKQTTQKVTVAARVYETDEEAKPAFGKNNPYKHGVLPILVVIENGTGQALKADRIKIEYMAADRTRVEATPASEVRFLHGAKKPGTISGPVGIKIGRGSKNPLATWEIEGRAFSMKMIPAGESAHGFFYFQTGFQSGSTLYVTGLSEAASGKEIFYFEIPLRDAK